jgi:hypothetical protein
MLVFGSRKYNIRELSQNGTPAIKPTQTRENNTIKPVMRSTEPLKVGKWN